MFKRKKSYDELRTTLFDTATTTKDRESILLSLLNDPAEEAISIFTAYLKDDSESTPINPIFNYRGEFISGIKTLLVSKVGRVNKPETKNFLFHLLGKYYLFPEMRNTLLTTLGTEYNARDQALSVIFTQASQENIPINIYSDLISEYLKQLPEKTKLSYSEQKKAE